MTLGSHPVQFQPYADHGMLCTFGTEIEVELGRAIARLADALDGERLPGVLDLVPSYTTLLLILDPGTADLASLTTLIQTLWTSITSADHQPAPQREVLIPVHYGQESGPDLADVARQHGLGPDEVIARHAGAHYEVGAIGFAPGFAFLVGLDPALATPRRTTPRTRVPAGSVAIGGGQTGVYSLPTPGGWNLIGRTPEVLFDPDRDPPSLLKAGDAVRFVPQASSSSRAPKQCSAPTRTDPPNPALEIASPGLQTTVQDLGRTGFGRIGVAPGGAADRGALIHGNRLLGNPDNAAGLEVTLSGPTIHILRPLRFAVSGADLGAELDGMRVPPGAVRVAGPGHTLTFTRTPRVGARAYLCLAGGIEVPVQLVSRATDLVAGFGGGSGRPLQSGDRLAVGPPPAKPMAIPPSHRLADPGTPIRVMPGPQRNRFSAETWETLLTTHFTVSSLSNRMGVRLDGPLLIPQGGADIISEGVVTGAIQVTGEGQPIIMGVARATIGGYPKIATVIAADLDRIGQLRPGDSIRFARYTLPEQAAPLTPAHGGGAAQRALSWAHRILRARIR